MLPAQREHSHNACLVAHLPCGCEKLLSPMSLFLRVSDGVDSPVASAANGVPLSVQRAARQNKPLMMMMV